MRPLLRASLLFLLLPAAAGALPAATLTIACSAIGIEYRLCREGAETWAARAGHEVRLVQTPNLTNDRLGLYQQLLAAGSADVDVFQIDVIWPGILGAHFIDLTPYIERARSESHFAPILRNNRVGGELKALPWYTDAGLLFYRKDLLQKYGRAVPDTWAALEQSAALIMNAERKAGNGKMYGFVFQGRSYEGLTCNALEWIDSHGGGRILDRDGRPDLDNPRAAAALRMAAGWVGTIAPRGVLTYAEEEARGVFQAGHAVFMRNWPYAWALANGPDSPVKGKVGVTKLPRGGPQGKTSGTLGGWNLAVSRYSRHPALAAALILHLTGPAEQKRRAIAGAYNPTLPALYRDPEVLRANPFFAFLPATLAGAVGRPSDIAGEKYNRLSTIFWEAVHDVLSGEREAGDALADAQGRLERLSQGGRW